MDMLICIHLLHLLSTLELNFGLALSIYKFDLIYPEKIKLFSIFPRKNIGGKNNRLLLKAQSKQIA